MTMDYAAALDLDQGYVPGLSGPMQTLESVISEIAPTDIPLLLIGESGTGKEVFAHRVHRLSQRSGEPLKKIACASMDGDAFVAELGAKMNRSGRGRHTEAHQAGTLFFDEVAELDAGCQRILLSILPDGVAALRPPVMRARVISTTNRNLDEEVRSGHFRSELYYRINGVCLRLPPLRERKEDIAALVEYFLTKHAVQLQRPRISLSERTMGKLLDYSWPGNIRELENVVKEIVALGDENLAMSVFSKGASVVREANASTPRYSLKDVAKAASREAERELILKALARTRWNRKRAAQELQISYKSLLYKLKQIGCPGPEAS